MAHSPNVKVTAVTTDEPRLPAHQWQFQSLDRGESFTLQFLLNGKVSKRPAVSARILGIPSGIDVEPKLEESSSDFAAFSTLFKPAALTAVVVVGILGFLVYSLGVLSSELATMKQSVATRDDLNSVSKTLQSLVSDLHMEGVDLNVARYDRLLMWPIEGSVEAKPSSEAPGMFSLYLPGAEAGRVVPVVAIEDGTVMSVRPDPLSEGFSELLVKHSNGYQTVYGHVQDVQVQLHQALKRGQEIGSVVAASPICLRLGVIPPGGDYVTDIESLFPLLPEVRAEKP